MNLLADLEAVVKRASIEYERTARERLRDVGALSLNERETLEELGEPHQWPSMVLELGRKALHLSQHLSAPEWHSSYIIQDAVDPADPYHGIPHMGLELALAEQIIQSMAVSVPRVQDLVWEAVIAKLSARASGYLERVGRCYIAGFDEEVVILCRSALDVALRDALGDGPEAKWPMAARVKEAASHGMLSDDGVRAATTVRVRGNAAVHEEPASQEIARDTLQCTILVLEELFGDQWER